MKLIVPALLLAVAAVSAAALSHGDYPVAPPELVRILTGGEANPQAALVVMEFRLPRVLLGMVVGVALAVAGAVTQAIMRNPLAEPSILGINSGAALAAVVVIVHLEGRSLHLLPWLSFLGALAMTVLLYLLSWRGGTSAMRIVLVGIGLNALAGAAATFISTFGEVARMQQAMVWLAGSVYDSSWEKLGVTLAWVVPPIALIWLLSRELDVLTFDDLAARGLGQRVDRARAAMMLLCALACGAAVSAAGLVGFIGLVAPHIARRLVGPAHARLVPVSALVGALLVICADFAGRTVIAPAQLPVGLTTAILGAPFFIYLMWRRRA